MLIIGGHDDDSVTFGSIELYDIHESANNRLLNTTLDGTRHAHVSVILDDNTVIFASGVKDSWTG